jgi:hypothetical protein
MAKWPNRKIREGTMESPSGRNPTTEQPPIRSSQALALLNAADWRRLQLKLLEYALFKVRRLSWRTGREVLPKGHSAEDLVIIAIQKTFEGAHREPGPGETGIRRWNPESCPDLLTFLKSVVDSDVYHLVTSDEHRMTDYGSEVQDWGAPRELESEHARTPEELFLKKSEDGARAADDFDGFFQELLDEFREDREVTLVLLSYREQSMRERGIKPAQVAREMGLPIEDVRNAIKRMRRKILGIREEERRKERELHVSI